mmetsp:Transcript_26367/g.41722  ORF Transcript_26367/g.41722 Transcript_26367/m.41722 type:complete len:943 (-) Transcript_26367:296-3124(-)
MASKDAGKKSNKSEPTPKKGESEGKPRAPTAKQGYGIVKSVLSGSSVVISGIATQGNAVPPEKVIILSGVNAPRLQRSKDKEPDEPYSFHAREFLRKLLAFKQVSFTINHTNQAGREYGNLIVDGKSVTETMVAAGYATVKPPANKDGKMHADREALFGIQTQAEKAGRGMHSKTVDKNTMIRKVNYDPDNFKFFFENRGKPVPVLIDYVRNASTLSVEILHPDLKHSVTNVTLCGINAPRTAPAKRKNGAKGKGRKEEKAHPVAAYAQYFVQKRLLNREMQFIPLGIDKYGNLYGRVQFADHPERDITKMLLKHGLGRFLPWTAALCDPKLAEEYRACEAQARAASQNIWRYIKPAEVKAPEVPTVTSMRVVMVSSGDSLIVADAKGKERRVNLASIRAPRLGRREGDESEPLAWEAKEYLRRKLVGKRVNVRVEYRRGGQGTPDFVTIEQGKININEQLCTLGYAKVVPHKLEEARATNYISLVVAEKKAELAKKGVHSGSKDVHKFTDLTDRPRAPRKAKDGEAAAPQRRGEADVARAKAMLPTLGSGSHKGHVEYVISGSKLKVYLTSKKIMLNVVLAGVQVPRPSGRNDKKGDKYGNDAQALVRSLCLQHNVTVEFASGDGAVDRRGNFVGYVWTESPRKSIASALLEQGLAKIFLRSAEAGSYLEDLRKAERGAKSKRLRMWENFDEELKKRQEARAAAMKAEAKSKNQKIKVTEIVDGVTFYAQLVEDKNIKVIEDAMAAIDGESPADYEPEFGEVAACKFDGAWYRVQVSDVDEELGFVDVIFIDYGNKSRVNLEGIVPIPENLKEIAPLAKKFTLACVTPPMDGSGWTDTAFERLGELTYDQTFDAEVLFRDNKGISHVNIKTKGEDKKEVPLQSMLLKEGLARIVKRPDYSMKFLVGQLRSFQAEGVEGRKGIWEYGEVSDEEEEDPRRKRK